MPTRILEIAKTRQGESRTPFTWTDVKRNVPIEDWRFTEDMPQEVGAAPPQIGLGTRDSCDHLQVEASASTCTRRTASAIS